MMYRKNAFSLVELSIVLVILGLLVGGILAGQSLIRASELRSVTSQIEQYRTATHSFRDQYFALPGDMTNATLFWGTSATSCMSSSTAVGPLTCNGNGNGVIDSQISNGTYEFETFRFWQHLGNAGLITGNLTGAKGPNTGSEIGAFNCVTGVNCPATKISGTSVMAIFYNTSRYEGWYALSNNIFNVGGDNTELNMTGFLKPEEQWNIDTKFDDGLPATGTVRAMRGQNYCATTGVVSTALYNLTRTDNICILGMFF